MDHRPGGEEQQRLEERVREQVEQAGGVALRAEPERRPRLLRAELPFLLLDECIIEMHIILNGRYILMPEQLLEGVNVTTKHEIAHSKRMAEDVRANTLALRQINPTTKTLKQHVYTTTSQGKTAFTQKHMIFVRITNRQQRIAVLAIPINVEKQSA